MKKSSYHNTLQSWIKNGMLVSYKIIYKKIPNRYNEVKKIYEGKKELSKVLELNFYHCTRFVREWYIEEYLYFIEGEKNMKNIIVGNWKMNMTKNETLDFLKEFKSFEIDTSNLEYGIASSFTSLETLISNKANKMLVFAQNMSEKESGAFTGEVSVSMLKELGVDGVILGHSERRQYFSETNEKVNLKAKLALKNKLLPIICVGETLEEKEKGITEEVVKKQVLESIAGIKEFEQIIIAYEPIWAIGTGKTSSSMDAEKMCSFIKSITSTDLRVQYGGSVKPNNIEEILSKPSIDGALVGGASLEAKSFKELIN